jgi:hypothetical protein
VVDQTAETAGFARRVDAKKTVQLNYFDNDIVSQSSNKTLELSSIRGMAWA